MRKKQVVSILLICAVLASLTALLLGQKSTKGTLSPFSATFLKVGKADAFILECEGMTMVIDTGEEDDGQELVDTLKEKHISQVDILVITHYDKDHVGGADTLLSQMPVVKVLVPDYEGSITDYAEFVMALKQASLTPEPVSETVSFPFGSAYVTIDPPKSYQVPVSTVEYDNNFSLVATITHGDVRMLFTGDIEKERIKEMLADGQLQECVFLKVPHHGIYNTALPDLLETVRPKYSVICSSDKNPAEPMTLELLKKYGADVLETRRGKITLLSDGQNIELRQKIKH